MLVQEVLDFLVLSLIKDSLEKLFKVIFAHDSLSELRKSALGGSTDFWTGIAEIGR